MVSEWLGAPAEHAYVIAKRNVQARPQTTKKTKFVISDTEGAKNYMQQCIRELGGDMDVASLEAIIRKTMDKYMDKGMCAERRRRRLPLQVCEEWRRAAQALGEDTRRLHHRRVHWRLQHHIREQDVAKLARAARRGGVPMKQRQLKVIEALHVREAPEGDSDNRDGLTLTCDQQRWPSEVEEHCGEKWEVFGIVKRIDVQDFVEHYDGVQIPEHLTDIDGNWRRFPRRTLISDDGT